MEQVLPFLEGMFYIATTDGDQPHLRIFDAAGILDGHLYIGTKSNKQVYAQIEKNPKVEIYVFSNELGLMRFTAEAKTIADKELNQKAYESTGKTYDEVSAAIELTNVRGSIKTKDGETVELNF